MRTRRIALIWVWVLVLVLALAACAGSKPSEVIQTPDGRPTGTIGADSSDDAPDSRPTGAAAAETGEWIPDNTIQSITFQFEDEQHQQAVEAWLKQVLYAEDYYQFVDGEDFDAPFDFDDESPIPAEYFAEAESHGEE